MRTSLDNPTFHVTDTRISAAVNSPYAVEILVKEGGRYKTRKVTDDEGLAFVPVKRDESFAVRLINNSPYGAGVTLTIDGVSMFAFSEKSYSQVVLGPRKSVLIKGWHRTNDWSEEFLVTEYSKSAAAKLNSTSDIGTITATFSAAWEVGKAPPPDESRDPSQHARSANATGRGPKIEDRYVEVQRRFGVIRAAVSVRYTK
jgi:hypothetical protein